jgi:hypothetical protein
MRLNWLLLKTTGTKTFKNGEYAFDSHNSVRFVSRLPDRNTRCPPRIVICFGSNSLKTGRANDDVANDVMNGIHTHLEHCTNPVLFVNHHERYTINSCYAGTSYVPTALAKGSAIAIRNLALLTPTLYVHVCEGAEYRQPNADFAVRWLKRSMPLLTEIHNGMCDVYVCHAASPEDVLVALSSGEDTPCKSDSMLTTSIPMWDVWKRKYTPLLITPWSKTDWWDGWQHATVDSIVP